jgi:hypothetical protein
MSRFRAALAAAITILSLPSQAAATDWKFRALLDGKPIGEHRVRVDEKGDDRIVSIEATFAVRVLGFTAYRYHHIAREQWRAGCLAGLESSTDDDGKSLEVRARREGDRLEVSTLQSSESMSGCVMTFAYWNPAILAQARLLNPQTGRLESVRVADIGLSSIDVRGVATPGRQYRITGPIAHIDVWYSTKGEWLGLDSLIDGKHTLSYRL